MPLRGDIRFGIVGCGRVSTNSIAPAIHRGRHMVLQGAASRDRLRAHKLRPIRVFHPYEALIDSPDIDAVYIGTHNGLHYPLVLRAIAAGKHVLCEKPLGCDQKEAEAMVSAAQTAGLNLAEAFMYRFHPQIRYTQELVAGGRIGDLTTIETSFRFLMNKPDDVRLRAEWGGGALLDVGCYCVNAARLFLGDDVNSTRAFASTDVGHGVDISVEGVLNFAQMQRAVISCGFDGGLRQSLALIGTEGVVSLSQPFISWEATPTVSLLAGRTRTERSFEVIDTFLLELEDLVATIRTGARPRYEPGDAIANARVLDRVRTACAMLP